MCVTLTHRQSRSVAANTYVEDLQHEQEEKHDEEDHDRRGSPGRPAEEESRAGEEEGQDATTRRPKRDRVRDGRRRPSTAARGDAASQRGWREKEREGQ